MRSVCGTAQGVVQFNLRSLGASGAMLSSLLKVAQTSSPMYNGDSELLIKHKDPLDRILESLLFMDSEVTRWLCLCSRPTTKLQQRLRSLCLCLELSGHGVLWFIICGVLLLFYLVTSDLLYFTHAINMFIILVADIVAVAPVKLFIKRPRPHVNTGTILLSVSSVDRYAFPSGHASRCVALATYIWYWSPSTRLYPMLWMTWTVSWCTWAVLVSLSRVLSGRHHVLDVIVGMAAGLLVLQTLRITNWFYY